MKKFTKLFLSCAMVATVASAAAVVASAETVDITNNLGSYDTETGRITINAPADLDAAQTVTFIAYEKPTSDSTSIDANTVVAIDQTTAGIPGANDNTGVKGNPQVEDEGKTYVVKIGYYNASGFTTASGELKLSTATGEEFVLGDIDGDDFLGTDGLGTDDAAMILKYSSGDATATGDAGKKITLVNDATKNGITVAAGKTIALGDVDGDDFLGTDGVSTDDASMVLIYSSGVTEGTGLAGLTVVGTVVTE